MIPVENKRGTFMKILIEKTSDWKYKEIKEYDSLESCVEELLNNKELYANNEPEVVVSKPNDSWTPCEARDCDYVVEIYNTWRE